MNKRRKIDVIGDKDKKKFLIDLEEEEEDDDFMEIRKISIPQKQLISNDVITNTNDNNNNSINKPIESKLSIAIQKIKKGNLKEALSLLLELKSIHQMTSKNYQNDFDYSLTLFQLAVVFEKLSKIDDSLKNLIECKEIQSKILLNHNQNDGRKLNYYLETLFFGALFFSNKGKNENNFKQSFLWFEERRQLMMKSKEHQQSQSLLLQIAIENSRTAKFKWIHSKYDDNDDDDKTNNNNKDLKLKRDLLLSSFTGDFFPFDHKSFISELIDLSQTHLQSKSSLPKSMKFELEFAKILNNVAINNAKTSSDRYSLFYLSLCIQHRLIAPDVSFDFEQISDWSINWSQLCPISWKILTSIQRLSRLLLLCGRRALDVYKKSVLICIFRTIANDQTQQQKYFNRLLSWSQNRKTLGKKKGDFYVLHLLGMEQDKKQFQFYLHSVENLKNAIVSKKDKWTQRIQQHISFLKGLLYS